MTLRTRWLVAALVAFCFRPDVCVAQASPDARAQALLGLARVKRDAGDVAAARQYFEELARVRPFESGERLEYFWVLAGRDAAAALTVGRVVLADAPDRADVRDRLITESIAVGDEAGVAALAREGERRDPATARWPRRLGEHFARTGHPAEATEAFARSVRAADHTIDDQADLAMALEASGRDAESIATWNAVSTAARSAHADWTRSYLRALTRSATDAAGLSGAEGWLTQNPADAELRTLVVDAWVRLGQPARAAAALRGAPGAAEDANGLRRAIALSRAAGLTDDALTLSTSLVANGAATAEDRRHHASLLIDRSRFDQARQWLAPMLATGCDADAMELVDRMPDAAATALMVRALSSPACQASVRWLTRGIERSVALAQHDTALHLIDRLPPSESARPEMRALAGQLQLWTGHAAAAVPLLEDALQSRPDLQPARESLMDAWRSLGRTHDAWTVAAPLLAQPALDAARLAALGDLALEAGHPELVASIAGRIPDTPANAAVRRGLLGRALAATGRPTDAARMLAGVAGLDAPAALALIDSVRTTQGPEAARLAARPFTDGGSVWRDVQIRRVVLETLVGDTTEAAALSRALALADVRAATIATAEIALAREQPNEALAALTTLAPDPGDERVLDLQALALAAAGQPAQALEIVGRLRAMDPASPVYKLREAELQYALSPSDETLDTLASLTHDPAIGHTASLVLARNLARAGRPAEALRALGTEADWTALPIDGQLIAAQSLRSLGRLPDASALLERAPASDARVTELQTELLIQMHEPSRATATLAAAAGRMSATPGIFLRWAELTADPASRATILARAAERFPTHAEIGGKLAAAEFAAGHRTAAADAARHALTLDARQADAWIVLIDLAAADGQSAIDAALAQLESSAGHQPELVAAVADRLSASVRSPDDPIVARLVSWIDGTPASTRPQAIALNLAKARVLAAAERWPDALSAIDTVLGLDAACLPALRLRADVLSWSGHHAEGLAAYDAYLARQPDDLDARRQQARVAGWAGRYDEARSRYAALVKAHGDLPALVAEADAKTAFYDGRWRAAIDAYSRWIALEPDNGEARFERAESLRADARTAEADESLAALGATTRHQLASDAWKQVQLGRRPAVSFIADAKSTHGYGGQRMLDLQASGAAFGAAWGQSGRTTVAADAARVHMTAGDAAYDGFRGGVRATTTISPTVDLQARGAVWSLSGVDGPPIEGGVVVNWRPADCWTVGVGLDRSPMLENGDTVEQGLVLTGPLGSLRFESSSTTLDSVLAWQRLSDGNVRARVSATATHGVSERVRGLRLLVWSEVLAFRDASPTYFSPSHQFRLDAGAQVQLRLPRAALPGRPAQRSHRRLSGGLRRPRNRVSPSVRQSDPRGPARHRAGRQRGLDSVSGLHRAIRVHRIAVHHRRAAAQLKPFGAHARPRPPDPGLRIPGRWTLDDGRWTSPLVLSSRVNEPNFYAPPPL